MLTKFPTFKKLSLDDRKEIEVVTKKYPLYSDLNFCELWSWDFDNDFEVSNLNGNIVVKMKNFVNRKPLYVLYGDNDLENTVNSFGKYLQTISPSAVISLVPEEMAKKINDKSFLVKEDENNFDYIYETGKISSYAGLDYKKQRTSTNCFLKKYDNLRILKINKDVENCKKDLLKLLKSWKNNPQRPFDNELEKKAIKRMIEACDQFNFLGVGVYLDGSLIGATINEPLTEDFAINHCIMFDPKYCGVYHFLLRASCIILSYHGFKFLNVQQDLGLPGLRKTLRSNLPVGTFKKYTVELAEVSERVS